MAIKISFRGPVNTFTMHLVKRHKLAENSCEIPMKDDKAILVEGVVDATKDVINDAGACALIVHLPGPSGASLEIIWKIRKKSGVSLS